MVNVAILLSAWSAAASDIYISSRFLFFLARRGHAPAFLAHLFRYPRKRRQRSRRSDSSVSASEQDDSDDDRETDVEDDSDTDGASTHRSDAGLPPPVPAQGQAQPTYVMPLASVLVSASVGLLTFLSYNTGSAGTVFNWLVSVASVASLQSWAAMLFTYIRCAVWSSCLSMLWTDAKVWWVAGIKERYTMKTSTRVRTRRKRRRHKRRSHRSRKRDSGGSHTYVSLRPAYVCSANSCI